MKKHCLSMILSVILIILVLSYGVSAAGSVSQLSIAPSKTNVVPGEVVTFSINTSECTSWVGWQFSINIPEGLIYVDNTLAFTSEFESIFKTSIYDVCQIDESSKTVAVMATENPVEIPADLTMLSFQCTVDAEATGRLNVSLDDLIAFDGDYSEITSPDYEVVPATVTVAHNCVGVEQVGQSATCTQDGWNDYYKCSDSSCGKLYSDSACQNEITDFDAWTKGVGKIAGGHQNGTRTPQEGKSATCTEDGYKAYYKCTCGLYFEDEAAAQLIGDATALTAWKNGEGKLAQGHQNGTRTQQEGESATCKDDGYKAYYKCTCELYFEDEAATELIGDATALTAWKAGDGRIPAGHTYGTLIIEKPAVHTATKLEAGMKAHYFCDVCDTYFTAEKAETTEELLIIAAPVHEYNTTNGYREADGHADTCSCGAHNTVVGHTPDRTAPTEDDAVKCEVCDYTITPALGHIHKLHLTQVEEVPATCTTAGVKAYYKCDCNAYFKDDQAAAEITDLAAWKAGEGKIAASHSYGSRTLVDEDSASCDTAGVKAHYQCTCGTYFVDAAATIEILNYENWKTGAGKIPAGHDSLELIPEEPAVHTATELKAGFKAHYFCEVCDTYFTSEKTATTEANLVIPEPVHAYTTVNGYREADGHANTCSCDAHDTVVAHEPDRESASYTEDKKCSVCDYVIEPRIHKLITFVFGGATGSMAAEYCAPGTVFTLPDPAGKLTAPAGQQFAGWEVNGTLMEVGATITINADIEIKAVWEPIPATKNGVVAIWYGFLMRYVVTVETTVGGTVDAAEEVLVRFCQNHTFTITPDEGYEVSAVYVDGVDIGPVTEFTLEYVTDEHKISVVFAEIQKEADPEVEIEIEVEAEA